MSAHLAYGNSLSMAPTINDPSSTFSPYLPPVFEEPSSSFSDVAVIDSLPAIEGLQIVGEAFPGQELQACSYSINGTTSCNFEWVRYLKEGFVHYIAEAKQPNYPVTVDDVDSYLAIEVQPLDQIGIPPIVDETGLDSEFVNGRIEQREAGEFVDGTSKNIEDEEYAEQRDANEFVDGTPWNTEDEEPNTEETPPKTKNRLPFIHVSITIVGV